MKSNFLGTLLVGLLVFGAVVAAGLCLTYVQTARKLQRLQIQASDIGQYRALMQQLIVKSAEFGKTNAGMRKVLEEIGVKVTVASDEGAPIKPTLK